MTAFVAILTLTMVLCIGLNNGLLKDFYYQKKQEKVVHYYQKLDQLTNNKSENDSNSLLLAEFLLSYYNSINNLSQIIKRININKFIAN